MRGTNLGGSGTRKFFSLLKKDLLYFFRSKSSLALILLVPIIIIAILGNMFQTEGASGVSVLVCDARPGNISTAFTEALRNASFKVTVSTDADCAAQGVSALEHGSYAAVLFFEEGLDGKIRQGLGGSISVYTDSARRESANLVSSTVGAITQKASQKISVDFIRGAWANLEALTGELGTAREKLDETNAVLRNLNDTVTNLSLELSRLQFDSVRKDASDLESMMENLSSKIDSANSTMREGLEKIGYANETLNSSKTLLSHARTLLSDDMAQTEMIYGAVYTVNDSIYEVYNSLYCTPILCPQLYLALNRTWDLADTLEARLESERQMNESITGLEANLSIMSDDLANASLTLSEGMISAGELSSRVDAARSIIAELNSLLSDYATVSANSRVLLSDASSTINNMTLQISQAGPRLTEIEGTLNDLSSRDPRTVVSPLSLSENPRVNVSRFSYMFSAICAAILMFCCILLSSDAIMYERREGTLLRSFLSPTPLSLFVLSKLTALIVIAALQTGIMSFCAYFFFSARVALWPQFFTLSLLTSLCFIGLGLLIGLASRNQSSALLVSVLVIIPSMFLSGGLFPSEFMPGGVRLLGDVLPLTLSTTALRECAVYGFTSLPVGLLLYTIAFCIISLILLPKRAKEG